MSMEDSLPGSQPESGPEPKPQPGAEAAPSSAPPSMPDVFAEAVERLRAGETAAAVIASYPAAAQGEIGQLLAIVELAEGVAVQPVPLPTPERRQAARAQFLQQAQTLHVERERTLAAGAALPAPAVRRWADWREQLRQGWRELWDGPALRLAPLTPLAAVVLAVTLGTFWTVQSAQAALPGDLVYPLKQWVRQQRVALAASDQRAAAVRNVEAEVAAETQMVAIEYRDRAELTPPNTETMVYYGRRGNLLLFGPLQVAPNFQPDPNQEAFVAMRIDGDLEPGALVRLTYRVLPGFPNVVQGVSVEVLDAPQSVSLTASLPAPTSSAQSAVQPARGSASGSLPSSACSGAAPEGWVLYAVRADDSLDRLAAASGVGSAAIAAANCLPSPSLAGVSALYLPAEVVVRVTPVAMPSPLPTFTPTLEPPTLTPPTLTPEAPGVESTVAPTVAPPGETPLETPSAEPATGEPTATPAATPETTAESTPQETPASTSAATPTPASTAESESTPVATAMGNATPTPESTAGPTNEPTVAPTEEATSEPTSPPAVTPAVTVEVTPAATLPPVEPTAPPAEPTTALPAEPPVTVASAATSAPVEPPTLEPATAVPTRAPPEPPPAPPPPPEPPVIEPPIVEPPPQPEPPTPQPPPPDTGAGDQPPAP